MQLPLYAFLFFHSLVSPLGKLVTQTLIVILPCYILLSLCTFSCKLCFLFFFHPDVISLITSNFHLWNLKLKTTFQDFPWSASTVGYFFHSCIFYIFLHISSWLLLQCMQVFFSGTRWGDSGLEIEGVRIRNKLENL